MQYSDQILDYPIDQTFLYSSCLCEGKEISFKIEMDNREQETLIQNTLSELGIHVMMKQLKTGDFVINDRIVVERKTCLDFSKSIIDGRLFSQVSRMKSFFDSSFIIIEGNELYPDSIKIHSHAIQGALVNLSLIWQIPVLYSKNEQETAYLIYLIGKQDSFSSNAYCSMRSGRRPKNSKKQKLFILQGLPQIGPKLARDLLDHFGTVEAVITASESELSKVPKLGPKKASKIREVVSSR